MKTICSPSIYLLTLFCVGAAGAQRPHTVNDFVIDRDRPFVYLKIDHVGKGEPRSEDEPAFRVWLQLVNNCRVPIIVHTFGVPEGSPKYEQGVMYEVVASPPVFGGMQLIMPAPSTADSAQESTVQKEREQQTQAKSDETPRGYMFHVGSFQSIGPSEGVLFSVPVNHFDSRWHIEIPIEFDLPKGKGPRDPVTGGQPRMVVDYSLWDLPPKVRKDIEEKISQAPGKRN